MLVSIGAKTIIHPHPVLVVGTYNEDGKANLMSVSWGGICCSEPPCIAISLRKATTTYHNILRTQSFTVGIPNEDQVAIADYVGMVSGKNEDKFKITNLNPIESLLVEAPIAEEFPFTLECRLFKTIEIGLHTQFIGQILDIKAQESILSKEKLPDIEKVRPILYGSHGNRSYYGIGQNLGKAFESGELYMSKKKE